MPNNISNASDAYWMQQAIAQANLAAQSGEVPVGAVIVKNDAIIACGYNRMISNCDASAHAEIQALRAAGEFLHNYRIVDVSLYVTLEPCMMCVGAMVHARIKRLVFGAYDQKTGVAMSRDTCFNPSYHNHKVIVQGGVLEQQCATLLQEFFAQRR